ncbi:uncharacterized protein LOC114363701 [Ostrinia furnacalis]|uniref:uncharacterized protein LOC114363701 n=1 Tax=Ostrinia furnacalis TaxID=93504 RepID=UPI00103D3477|nr:uncharacterized protein LOC114363701 [Ostrinia furnacalis]
MPVQLPSQGKPRSFRVKMTSSQQEVLQSSKLQEMIETIIKNENFIHHHIHIKPIKVKNSYVGVYRQINIRGENKTGKKELHLFTKTMPHKDYVETKGFDEMFSITYAYSKEAFMYSEFSKTINELQEEVNIPVRERYTLAKSYASTDSDTIIFENLTTKGFEMYPPQEVITLKFAELAIKSLAKFHSFAFILKEKRIKFFEDLVKIMKQPFFYDTKSYNKVLETKSQIGINCLNPELTKRMQEYVLTTFDKYVKYIQDPKDTWTLVHGDYKTSNIMVQLKDGDVFNVMPVDYQLSFYGCPIFDLMLFMFSCTDQEFRKNHIEYLKNLYHISMQQFLSLFNMDVEDYYPRAEFERIYKERFDLGLTLALFMLPIQFNEDDASTSNQNHVLCERIRGVVDDYIQWGYL